MYADDVAISPHDLTVSSKLIGNTDANLSANGHGSEYPSLDALRRDVRDPAELRQTFRVKGSHPQN
jgi:hypothetical protein